MNDILISIRPNFVEKILDGKKTVELRTRRAKLMPGTRMWIYSTLPQGEVCAFAHVEFVYTDSPDSIWDQYSEEIGITEDEFWNYVGSRDSVSIIKMASVDPVESGVTLQYIQKKLGSFSPPQFFMRLKNDSPIHSLLHQAIC